MFLARQPQLRLEFVRLGNILGRFEITSTIDEAERLRCAVGTQCLQGYRCGRRSTSLEREAESRGGRTSEHRHQDASISGLDTHRFVSVAMRSMMVTMVVTVIAVA